MREGFEVTTTIDGAHRRMADYSLLEGDLIVLEDDGSYWKECPGISLGGFELTPEQVATLRPVKFKSSGLDYRVLS